VKYIHGIEVNNSGLSPERADELERTIEEYFSKQQTLEEFLFMKGFDMNRTMQKSFKKDGVSDLRLIL